jgi:outer membrane protein TolC
VNLVNQLDVSYQRLGIIRKQIGLAEERLEIAKGRFDDGRISQLTLLESDIFLLETKDRYLEELKKYLLSRIELESQYIS